MKLLTQKRPFFLFLIILMQSIQSFGQQTATDFFNIAQKAFQYKDYNNVIFFCNKAIALNPDYGAAYWSRAIAYDSKGEYTNSVSDYTRAMGLYDNDADLSVLHKNRGMVYNSMKKYDSAIFDFNKAITYNPDFGFAWWNKGISFDGLRQYDSAVASYTRAMQYFKPGNDLAQLYLFRGQDYTNLNNKDKATSDFKTIQTFFKEPGYYTAYAKFLLGNKKGMLEDMNQYLSSVKTKPKDQVKYVYFDVAALNSIISIDNEALKNLDLALKHGYNDFLFLSKDKDFDNIRELPAFKELVKKYKE
jgi:tetratricopeptide (TPR) repeat protein